MPLYETKIKHDELWLVIGKQSFKIDIPPFDEDTDGKVMSHLQYMLWWEKMLTTAIDRMIALSSNG